MPSHSFQESIIIPFTLYKSMLLQKHNTTSFNSASDMEISDLKKDTSSADETPKNINAEKIHPILKRQEALLNERLFKLNPYNVYSTDAVNNTQPQRKDINIYSNENDSIGIPIRDILSNIRSQSQIPNIEKVLEMMIGNGITWNSKGEIKIDGKYVLKSSIIEIMQFFAKSHSKPILNEPVGITELWQTLGHIIPRPWIRNKPNIARKELQPVKYPSEESFQRAKELLEKETRDLLPSDLNKYKTNYHNDSIGADALENETDVQASSSPDKPNIDSEKNKKVNQDKIDMKEKLEKPVFEEFANANSVPLNIIVNDNKDKGRYYSTKSGTMHKRRNLATEWAQF